MTKLGLIPLDDRPVSTTDPVLLAQLAGAEVITPPRELLGHPNQHGDTEALGRWWLENTTAVDGWVVALDMVFYGGLVASRTITEPLATILARLEILQAVRSLALNMPIYAFQSIRRLAVTVSTSDDLVSWESSHLGETPLKKERERNHLINLAVLEQIANGSLDVLNLLQEDARVDGPQRLEHNVLQEKIQRLNIFDKVTITTGCDEGAMVLITRLVRSRVTARRTLTIIYSSETGSRRTPLYEDRPIVEVANGQARAMGLALGAVDEADSVCLIWCPDRPCQDRMLGTMAEESSDSEVAKFISEIKKYLASGKEVVLADVADANGADPKLMTAIQAAGLLKQLSGFAAWNTAANTIGTALAQVAIFFSSPEFYCRRLLDDWGYQTVVRPKLVAMLRERGADIWSLQPEELVLAEKYLNEEMPKIVGTNNHSPGRFHLPWQRVFEIASPPGPLSRVLERGVYDPHE